jgi:hypothetical protein
MVLAYSCYRLWKQAAVSILCFSAARTKSMTNQLPLFIPGNVSNGFARDFQAYGYG